MYRLAKKTRKGLAIGRVEYSTLAEARKRQQVLREMGNKLGEMGNKLVIVEGYSGVIVK